MIKTIKHDDINDGYVIDKPGKYIISSEINISTCITDGFIITIASDDVILDGNDYTITQLNNVKHVFGIQVNNGIKNIQIHNIKLQNISGGGILCHGNNSNIVIKNVKINNCGYFGLTTLDKKYLPNSPNNFSEGILIEGPNKNIQIIDCVFVEMGILRLKNKSKYELSCGAILVNRGSDLLIKGCTIDGCVGYIRSWAISLINISSVLINDIFITDVYSAKDSRAIYIDNVNGEVREIQEASIISDVHPSQFLDLLDKHESVKYDVDINSDYAIEAVHFKGIVPKHEEKIEDLYKEHKWREFRTMYRLVCHNSDTKSRTSGIYAKWVELFCERVLGVKVRVETGFANLYLNGNTPLPMHRDAYKKWIFGISFGESRTIDFIPDNTESDIISYVMNAGDVLIFSHEVNNRYQHRMLEEPERTGRRINITYFIEVLPGQNDRKLLEPAEMTNLPTFEDAEEIFNKYRK